MAGFSPIVYTIGTALRRAQDGDLQVDLLVAGQWLVGHVSATDGQGVMLRGVDGDLFVVRLAGVDTVRISDGAAFEGSAPEPS